MNLMEQLYAYFRLVGTLTVLALWACMVIGLIHATKESAWFGLCGIALLILGFAAVLSFGG